VLYGEDFSLQRKARVFLILHRQPFAFQDIESHQLPRPGDRLRAYLEDGALISSIPTYIYTRLDGGYRDRPRIYHPDQREPVNLFTNYRRDRSLFLVQDERCPRGVRPFSLREVANLHGFPQSYQFVGPLGESLDMVVDSVMPPMAYALAQSVRAYLETIPHLADIPRPLGHREISSSHQRQEQLEEALHILREPLPVGDAQQLGLWI
jgi:site-specific DNA-cytosine methylase